jgi:hypothetical protein
MGKAFILIRARAIGLGAWSVPDMWGLTWLLNNATPIARHLDRNILILTKYSKLFIGFSRG